MPGHFQHRDSFIFEVDPRVKLIWTLALMAVTAFMLSTYLYAGLTVYLLALFAVSRLPWSRLMPALRIFLTMFVVTFLLHIMFGRGGGTVYFQVAGIEISSMGIHDGLLYSYRILLFMLIAAISDMSTSAIDMTDGILRLIKPLKHLRVPVGEIATMLFVALRFVPVLTDEARTIRMSQTARGLRTGGGLLTRIRSARLLVMPLMMGAVRRAYNLALAIESRGYRVGAIRSSMREFRLTWRDAVFVTVTVICLGMLTYLQEVLGS